MTVMKMQKHKREIMKTSLLLTLAGVACLAAQGFEGRIEAVQVRGDHSQRFVWQVGTNRLCIARAETNQPETRNLVALDTGEITFVFPHNRSYVRYRPEMKSQTPDGFPEMPLPPGGLPPGIGPQSGAARAVEPSAAPRRIGPSGFSGVPEMPVNPGMNMPAMPAGMPAGIGPQTGAVGAMETPATLGRIGPSGLSGMPEMPANPAVNMPAMPAGMPTAPACSSNMPHMPGLPDQPMEGAKRTLRRGEVEFTATGETTNLLGRACSRYEIRDRRYTMEVWATDQLVPFHPWQPNIPPRDFTVRRSVDEHWEKLLQERKLFPLLATLKNESGQAIPFEYKVTVITPEKGTDDSIFHPPADYHEINLSHL